MERIRRWFYRNIQTTPTSFSRYLLNQIKWNNRLIILIGARGAGKTTLMLQYIKNNHPINEETIYVSLDDIYFASHSLIDFTEEFSQNGGKYLFIDEVQKYKNWATEVKNIYDNFPAIKMVISGSSAVQIINSEADLSRRALFYTLNGLSFREYLNYKYDIKFAPLSLDEIINDHLNLTLSIASKIKPIKEFKDYLHVGYYPFFKEDPEIYHERVAQVINTILEVDIPTIFSIDVNATRHIKKLVSIIAEIVPFKPNVKKLSEQVGITRDSLIRYLQHLEKAGVINMLYSQTKGISFLNKPEKIYLNNSNISFALTSNVNIGNLRESFFLNQTRQSHKVRYPAKGDFVLDDKYTFEIGGRNKSTAQLKAIKNSWVVADDFEISVGNKIPLWLFGFMY